MSQYCEYCQSYTQWVTNCPSYRAHVQSCRTARLVALRECQPLIDARDKRIRELEQQLSNAPNVANTEPKVAIPAPTITSIVAPVNVPIVSNVETNISNNNAKSTEYENDFTIKYDKKNKQYTGTIDSENVKVVFTHKGYSPMSKMIENVQRLFNNLTI
ncbi:hypothetical protein F-LCD7_0243 [Faustovirus]|nr:hypothetical protein F-LCD7_0243 [Faustovirus]SMH63505.1 Hypothetical protein FSTVLC9_470 [Faustovirus]